MDGYSDLVALELTQNEEKVKELEAKVDKMNEIEQQSREYFKQQYNVQNQELDQMMKSVSSEQDRLAEIQKLINQSLQEHHDGDDETEHAHDRTTEPYQRQDMKVINSEVAHTVNDMFVSFLGVLAIAVVLGVAVGGICILACIRCYKRDQEKRLEVAQKVYRLRDRSSTVDTFGNHPIDMQEEKTGARPLSNLDTEDVRVRDLKR